MGPSASHSQVSLSSLFDEITCHIVLQLLIAANNLAIFFHESDWLSALQVAFLIPHLSISLFSYYRDIINSVITL